jgi:Protein of unknown function (DUF1580)
MCNFLDEDVLTLAEAARRLPRLSRGRPTSPTTVWRWSRSGVSTPAGQIRLEVFSFAGRTVTTWQAVQRFLAAVARARGRQAGSAPTPTGHSTSPSAGRIAAKAMLDRQGI